MSDVSGPHRYAVVTSVYGEYDEMPPTWGTSTPMGRAVEWVAVTDGKEHVPEGWRHVVEPRPRVHPRLAAKVAKTQPWLYTDADVIIWMDAACRLKDEQAIDRLAEWSRDLGPMAQFRHPDRTCIFAEGAFSAPLLKYADQPVAAQMESYTDWVQRELGLWATGLIVYRLSSNHRERARLKDFGESWLAEQVRFTDQDQLSQVPMALLRDLLPGTLPGYLWDNEALTWAPHRSPY